MVIGATKNMATDLSVWFGSNWALTTDGTHNSWKVKIVVRQWHGYRNDTVTKWKIDTSTKYLLIELSLISLFYENYCQYIKFFQFCISNTSDKICHNNDQTPTLEITRMANIQ